MAAKKRTKKGRRGAKKGRRASTAKRGGARHTLADVRNLIRWHKAGGGSGTRKFLPRFRELGWVRASRGAIPGQSLTKKARAAVAAARAKRRS